MQLRASLGLKASCSGRDGTIASLPSLPIPSSLDDPLPMVSVSWVQPGTPLAPPYLPGWKVYFTFCLSVKGKLLLGRDVLPQTCLSIRAVGR